MNTHELKEPVFGGESGRVESKHSTGQRTEAAKTTCGMLNGLGGFVLFGVTDSGDIMGQQVSAKTLEDIAAVLRRIEPPAFPDIETISLKKVVSIPHGYIEYTIPDKPNSRLQKYRLTEKGRKLQCGMIIIIIGQWIQIEPIKNIENQLDTL